MWSNTFIPLHLQLPLLFPPLHSNHFHFQSRQQTHFPYFSSISRFQTSISEILCSTLNWTECHYPSTLFHDVSLCYNVRMEQRVLKGVIAILPPLPKRFFTGMKKCVLFPRTGTDMLLSILLSAPFPLSFHIKLNPSFTTIFEHTLPFMTICIFIKSCNKDRWEVLEKYFSNVHGATNNLLHLKRILRCKGEIRNITPRIPVRVLRSLVLLLDEHHRPA